MSNDPATPSGQSSNPDPDSEQESPFSIVDASNQLAELGADSSSLLASPIASVVADRIRDSDDDSLDSLDTSLAFNPLTPTAIMSTPSAGQSAPSTGQFAVAATKRTVGSFDRVLFKREDRKNLDDDKRNALYKEATSSKRQTKFSHVDVSNTSDAVLEDAYNIDTLIKFMQSNLITYDMHSVFAVVYPEPVLPGATDTGALQKEPGGGVKTADLFLEYSQLSPDEVAASNVWHNEWASDVTHADNLKLVQQYLVNNVNEDLAAKTLEDYAEHQPAEQGGTLFFVLMLHNLLSNSREAAIHLENKIKSFKISSVKGEDVNKVVSHLRGALRRLIQMQRWDRTNDSHARFFINMNLKLLQVFRTTSVPKFNELFAQYETGMKLEDLKNKVSGATVVKPPNPFDIFSIANTQYNDMCQMDEWSGATTKGVESFFFTADGEARCFNCMKTGCSVDKCPEPKNEDRIAANRKKFWEIVRQNRERTGRGGRGGGGRNNGGRGRGGRGGRGAGPSPNGAHLVGKFAPPSKQERNCRVIDGKAMKFDGKSKKWVPDKAPPDNIKALISFKPDESASTVTFADDESLNSARRRMANASKSIQATLASLTNTV